MYRMVTQRHVPTQASSATTGQSTLTLKGKAWEQQIKPVSQCNAHAPKLLADLIHRCLAYNPNERPEYVTDVQKDLDLLVGQLVNSSHEKLEALDWAD
jgi:hypothetical protein